MTIDEARAKEILVTFYQGLNSAVVTGYRNFLSAMGDDAVVYDSITRANMAQAHICFQLAHDFVDERRILPMRFPKLRMFKLDSKILFKIKKLDRSLKSKTLPSKRNSRFRNQLAMFVNLDSMLHLELGYVVDHIGGAISGVHIVCPKNETEIVWSIDLFKELSYNYTPGLFDKIIEEAEQPDYGLPEFILPIDTTHATEQNSPNPAEISATGS